MCINLAETKNLLFSYIYFAMIQTLLFTLKIYVLLFSSE